MQLNLSLIRNGIVCSSVLWLGQKVWPRGDFIVERLSGTLGVSHLPMPEKNVVLGYSSLGQSIFDQLLDPLQHVWRRKFGCWWTEITHINNHLHLILPRSSLTSPIANQTYSHTAIVVPGCMGPNHIESPALIHLSIATHAERVSNVVPTTIVLVEALHRSHGRLTRLGGVAGRRNIRMVDYHVGRGSVKVLHCFRRLCPPLCAIHNP